MRAAPWLAAACWLLPIGTSARDRIPQPPVWQIVGPPFSSVRSISIAPDADQTLYAAASDPVTARSGIFRSRVSGATWELVAEALSGETADTVRVDPREPRRVFATTVRTEADNRSFTRVYRSMDAGGIWEFLGDVEACGGAFAFDTADPLRVYFALRCAGGLYVSQDAGASWSLLTEAFRNSLVAGPEGTLFAATDDGSGVLRSNDGGTTWTALTALPGIPPTHPIVLVLAIDPLGRLLTSTVLYRFIALQGAQLLRLEGLADWTLISDVPLDDVVFDTTDPARVYSIRYPHSEILGSRDGGETWRSFNLPESGVVIWELALSASGDFLFAATPSGVFRLEIRAPRPLTSR